MKADLDPDAPVSGFPTRRLVLAGGVSIRWLDTGPPPEGQPGAPPVLLVHGLAASIGVWAAVLPTLAARRRVVAFDLPGFGHADKPDADYRAETFFVPALDAFLDASGVGRAHMVGSSLGASLLIRHGARWPRRHVSTFCANPGGFGRYIHPFLRVPTLPLLGGPLSRPRRALNAFAASLATHDRARRTSALIDEADALSRLPGAHRAFVRTLRGVAGPLGVRDRPAFESDARTLDRSGVPVALVWGRHDRIFPARQAKAAQRSMPSAALHMMEGAGHYPQIDRPEAFAALALDHAAAADDAVSRS